MIIQNGNIEIKTKTAGGIDPTTGFPIAASSVSYGTPIPCQYIANMYNQLGRSNGEAFTMAQYTILIEQQPTAFSAEQLRLKDMAGNVVGDFSVVSVEKLDAVSQVRITV